MKTKLVGLACLAGLLAVGAQGALAQQKGGDYPSKPLKIIVPFAPGASNDINARMLGQWLEGRWKQPVVVENRPGGLTVPGTDAVVKSAADGYTLLVTAQNVSYLSLVVQGAQIDPKDLTPIAIISGSGYVLMATSSLPVKTLAELVAYSKANPGKLNYGLAGGAVLPEMEELRLRIGLDLTHVQYKGGAQVYQAFSTGEVHFFPAGVFQAIPLVNEGKGRALAYTELNRHRAIPDVPTVAESRGGAPGFDAHFWIGLLGPAGMPRDIVNRLNREVIEMTQSPENLGKMRNLGYNTYPVTPTQMADEMKTIRTRVATLVAKGVLKPQ